MVEAIPGNAGRADYPRMLYHADGRQVIVQNPETHQAHLEQGFSAIPQPRHQQFVPPKNPVGGDSLQDIYRMAMERVLDERGITKAWVRRVDIFIAEQAPHLGSMSPAPGAQVAYTTGELPPVPLTPRRTDNGK